MRRLPLTSTLYQVRRSPVTMNSLNRRGDRRDRAYGRLSRVPPWADSSRRRYTPSAAAAGRGQESRGLTGRAPRLESAHSSPPGGGRGPRRGGQGWGGGARRPRAGRGGGGGGERLSGLVRRLAPRRPPPPPPPRGSRPEP